MGPPDADARAAGVMPGTDPYKELELYLEKVNEEIGEVFEKWDSPITKKSINVVKLKTPPDLIAPQNLVLPNIQGKLPTRKYHSLPRRIKHKNQNFILPPETWLENLLSEFNSIVSDELEESEHEGKVSKDKDTEYSNEDQVDQVAKHSYQNNLPDLISKSCDDLQTGHCQQTQTSPPSSSWRSDSSDCCSVTSLSSIEDGASVLSSAASTPDRLADYSSSTVNDDFLHNYSNLNLSPDQTQSPFHSSIHSNDFVQSDSSSQVRRDTAESFNQNCNTIPKSPSVRRKDSMRHRTETTSDPNLARPDTLPLRLNSPASMSDTPSSTSLRLENISSELLTNKSSSAPMLKSDGSSQSQRRVLKQPRSQSDRHLTEIEASEACKWLRAAGFPQYAQMFEDHQFPIDINSVQKDHPFLEPDSLRSLFRRLQCLNKCAKVKMNFPLESINDSDSEPDIAHSNMWTYQKENQRWSRLCNVQPFPVASDESSSAESPVDNETLSLQNTINQVIDPPSPRENEGKPSDNSPISHDENLDKKELPFDNNEHLKLVWERKTSTPVSPTSPSNDKQSFNSHKVPGKSSIIRWHSFHNKTLLEESQLKRKSMLNSGQLISLLTVGQLHLLRRLSLLKLTALMDRYCPMSRSSGWTWELPKFMTKKTKFSHFKNSNSVFGVPLLVNIQKTGYALPRFIISSFEWLINNASDQIGIFRKPGVKTRIQKLREMADEGDFKLDEVDSQQAYDVADLVKQYFRELPEVLLTNKSSETFMSIFQHIPDSFRLEAVSCALVLLPDEHREALYLLLHFLRQIAKHSTENQMTESNLAVCFAPSLFHWNQSASSPYKKNKSGIPDAKELTQNKAAHDCLFYLIAHYDQVFCISKDLLKQCNFSYMDDSIPVTLHELGNDIGCNWRTYLKSCMTAVIKEAKEKSRGWVEFATHNKVDIFYKKISDEHPLRLWKIVTEVEAPPRQVLKRILWERSAWDPDLAFERSVLKLDTNIEVYNYVDRTLDPLPDRNFCVVRSWITEPARDACIIVETSVEHADAPISPRSVRGIVLASRYLIEPCGSGRSRILHLSRIDVRGRTCEWYNKAYAFDCAKYVVNIRESFHRAEGMLYDHPNARESKV
uniref:Rho GTPase-activating protein 7 n=1 Tax=Cacopsylla melanoneura TaxID=428564 RepID=A0A8D8LXI8_9HEMI